jgi:hypothetical protein
VLVKRELPKSMGSRHAVENVNRIIFSWWTPEGIAPKDGARVACEMGDAMAASMTSPTARKVSIIVNVMLDGM